MGMLLRRYHKASEEDAQPQEVPEEIVQPQEVPSKRKPGRKAEKE